MAKSSVQPAIKFSVDRLGYESLKPEQETVVGVFLGSKNVYAALPTGYGKSLCCACFPQALTSAEHTDRAACIYKCFRMSH